MVEDDAFTYHVKQQPTDQINKAAQSMITKERTQKLDLLIHLLSNLTQALVVCGPEGIGKTTLLRILQERKTESWRYCLIQGNTDVSFEAIQEQLVKAQSGKSVQSLSTTLGQYEDQYKLLILIIDNAGELVPGLIAAIIQYAAANPVLRVIFALTHDELQVKRGSDRVIDDCHVVEIPPLSEKQCGDFLQHLSTRPYTNLSFKAVGDNMIAHIYRETHGVPGRIIAKISGLSSGAKQGGKLKWVLALAVAAAIVIALGVQWLISSAHHGNALLPASIQPPKNNDKKAIASAAVEQKTDNIEIAPLPQPEPQIMLTLPPVQSDIRQQSVPAIEVKDALEPSVEVNIHGDDQQPVTLTTKPEAVSTAIDKQLTSDVIRSLAMAPASPKVPALGALSPDLTSRDGGNAARLPGAVAAMPSSEHPMPHGAEQEKQKQSELKKTVNSVEPFTPNSLETIQTPQKPVEVAAVPEERVIETPASQQVAPEQTLAQSENDLTLQLMVLSKQSSVNDILKRYPAMESDLRIIKSVVKGKEKFILEYGSYPDAASAHKAKESLPFEFRRALVRKIAR